MGWCASCHQKDHPVTAEGGTPVGNQAYWYSFQKPVADASGVRPRRGALTIAGNATNKPKSFWPGTGGMTFQEFFGEVVMIDSGFDRVIF